LFSTKATAAIGRSIIAPATYISALKRLNTPRKAVLMAYIIAYTPMNLTATCYPAF
jgi:hypothetical protein